MKKKILFVIPSPHSFNLFLKETAIHLINNQYEVDVICKKYDNDYLVDGVNYHFLNIPRHVSLFKAISLISDIRNLIRRLRPDIVHSHFLSAAFLISLSLPFEKDIFKVCTIQGSIYTATRFSFKKVKLFIGEQLTYFFQDKVYFLTEDDYLRVKRYAFKGNIFLQWSPGFGTNLGSEIKMLNVYDKPIDSEFKLIYVGRLVNFKGFPIVFRTFMELYKKGLNVTLTVCGNFDNYYSSGLSADELNILNSNPNIRLQGFVDNVIPFLIQSDLNFFPSQREGMPVNLMESVVVGLPCLVYNSRGSRHIIRNYVNGIIVDSLDITEYIKNIERLYFNRDELFRLSQNCISMRNCYDRQLYTSESINLYESVLAK